MHVCEMQTSEAAKLTRSTDFCGTKCPDRRKRFLSEIQGSEMCKARPEKMEVFETDKTNAPWVE